MTEENETGETMEAAAPDENNAAAEPEQKPEDKYVPLEALQKEREERQRIQDEVRMLKEHLALTAGKENKKDELNELADDDVLTVGEAKKFIERIDQKYKVSLTELKMSQKYPDYENVIRKYLPEVLKENPSLSGTLQKTQDYELAYYLAKNSEAYKKENAERKKNRDAERIINNSETAGSLSSVGSQSPIDEAKRYKTMSDEDFMKAVNRNLGYF